MALKDKVPALLQYIKSNSNYLEWNHEILDIFQGNLKPYVLKIMKSTLSENYYDRIKSRVIPINVLRRITDKVAKSYIDHPDRIVPDQFEDDMDYYETQFCMDSTMLKSDEYASLFKGYALEPYLHQGVPKLRVLPFDRFLPYSDDPIDPSCMTVFIKFMGKVKVHGQLVQRDLFYAYSADEFYAFLDNGDMYPDAMVENQGINPYGVIPFFFGSRSDDSILPVQDTDTSEMTKMIPVMLSDLGGAIMFQCFTIMYGIDVNAENLTMSPNAFWSLKSDKTTDNKPQLGTLKPEADIDKVVNFIMTIFSFWLETRGIKVGNIGQINGSNFSSGISKIIDEMDVTEIVMKSMRHFAEEEPSFWEMFSNMNNYWVSTGQIQTDYIPGIWNPEFKVTMKFDDPEPTMDRLTLVDVTATEENAGYLDRRSAIARLYPDLTPDQIEERIKLCDEERTVTLPLQVVPTAPGNANNLNG